MKLLTKASFLLAAGVLLAACNDNKDDTGMMAVTAMPVKTPLTAKYLVTVTNMTAGQPFSPPVLMLHGAGYHAFEEGKAASVGLEMIAESGKNAEFAAEAMTQGVTALIADSAGPILPGQSRSFTLETAKANEDLLSMASMIGKTNDGFTGVDNLMLDLKSGESLSVDLPGWDAGTEANTETAATLGALGGEGFNAARNDSIGVVTIHAGVLSNAESPTSALTEMQRFDNPVLKLTIRRM